MWLIQQAHSSIQPPWHSASLDRSASALDLPCMSLDCGRNLQKAALHQLGLNSEPPLSEAAVRTHSFSAGFIHFSFSTNAIFLALAHAESSFIKWALLEPVALKPSIKLSSTSGVGNNSHFSHISFWFWQVFQLAYPAGRKIEADMHILFGAAAFRHSMSRTWLTSVTV